MAFNAGEIQATMVLDRSPFQRGLDEAKAEAKRFEDETFKAELDVTGDQESKQKIDSVETSGRKLANSNPKVKVDADDALVQQKIARLEAKLEELRRQKATPTIDLDIAAAEVQRQKIADQLDALAAKKADPKIDLDIAAAQLKRVELVAKLDEIQAKPYTAKAELDEGKLLIQIAQVEQRLQALADKKATLQIDTDEVALNVKLAAIQAKIDRLNGEKATITVDADIAAAESQMAALQATTAGAGDSADAAAPKFNLMAAGIAAGFPPASTAVLALTGALELAAAPMLAIKLGMTGIQAAAAPLAGDFLNLQSIVSATFENGLKPAVTDISALMPTLQNGFVGTASALSGVAVEVGKVVSSQPGLVAIQATFSNIQSVISAMSPGIAGFAQNILDLGTLGTGSLTGLATIVNNLSTQWHTLITNLTSSGVAQVAIESLVNGLGAVASIIPPLVQAGVQLMAVIGPPLAAALQAVSNVVQFLTGPLGGLTTTVLASVVAWKAATAAAALFQAGLAKIGIGAAAASTASAAATAGAVSWLPAANNGAASAGRFATGLAAVGGALPLVAVGVVAAYAAVKSFTTSTDEAVAAMAKGGAAAADMTAKVASQTQVSAANASAMQKWGDSVDNWISSEVFGIATIDSVKEAQDKHRASLTDLQRAQEDATKAAGDYQQALDKNGQGSIEATDAQKKLAEATLRVAQEQAKAQAAAANVGAAMQAAAAHFGDAAQKEDGAAQSAISYANALATLAQPLASASDKMKAFAADVQGASDAPRTLLDALNAANSSLTSFAESSIKITPALIDASGAINTTTKAGQELATGISGSAKAFDNLRGATIASAQAAGDDMPTALAKGGVALEDFRQKLIAQAQQHGATRDQAEALVNTYFAFPPSISTEFQQPGMVKAYVDALGLSKAIVDIPNDKSIIVKSLSDEAKQKLEDLGLTVTKLPDGRILVTADAGQAQATIAQVKSEAETRAAVVKLMADPTAFNNSVHDGVGLAEMQTPKIPVGATMEGFYNSVRDGVGAALATPAVMPLSANASQFDGALSMAVTRAGSTLTVMPMDGNPDKFNGKLTAAVTLANGSTGVLALDGNPTLVNGKITQAVTLANGAKGTMTLDANPDPATGRINGTVTYGNGQTSRISVDANTAAAEAAINNAARPRSTTITVTEIYVGSSPAQVRAAGAGGGLVGFAGGGIVPMASGGILPGYAPGTDNIPAILSPGEAVLVPELVRQLGPGNILAANMAASGRQPTFWNGAKPVGGDGVALGSLSVGSGGSPVATVLAAFAARIEKAVADQATTSEVTQKLTARVDDLVSEIRRSGAGASIVVNDRSGDPVETARETTLRLRLRR